MCYEVKKLVRLCLLMNCVYVCVCNGATLIQDDDDAIRTWISNGIVPKQKLGRSLTLKELRWLMDNGRVPKLDVDVARGAGDLFNNADDAKTCYILHNIGLHYAKCPKKEFFKWLIFKFRHPRSQYLPAQWINILSKQNVSDKLKNTQFSIVFKAYCNGLKNQNSTLELER